MDADADVDVDVDVVVDATFCYLRTSCACLHTVPPFVINTVQVRVPYKTLIEQYAMDFFSAPVPCKMGESINTLEKRSSATTYANEKKKANEKKANAEKKADTSLVLSTSSA